MLQDGGSLLIILHDTSADLDSLFLGIATTGCPSHCGPQTASNPVLRRQAPMRPDVYACREICAKGAIHLAGLIGPRENTPPALSNGHHTGQNLLVIAQRPRFFGGIWGPGLSFRTASRQGGATAVLGCFALGEGQSGARNAQASDTSGCGSACMVSLFRRDIVQPFRSFCVCIAGNPRAPHGSTIVQRPSSSGCASNKVVSASTASPPQD